MSFTTVFVRGSVAIIALVSGMVYFERSERIAYTSMPADESHLIRTVEDYRQRYEAANEIAKLPLRAERAAAICQNSNAKIKKWSGTIEESNMSWDGEAELSIRISPNITLNTKHFFLGDRLNTDIKPGTPLFRDLATAKIGQRVEFDGEVFRDAKDCLVEMSLTESGGMISPDFWARFESVILY